MNTNTTTCFMALNRHGYKEEAKQLERDCDTTRTTLEAFRDVCREFVKKYDAMVAEKDAARESESRFRAEVAAGFRKHGLAAGPKAVDGLVRDLAAAKEDAERAKSERNGMHVKNYREWQQALADLAAERERNIRLNAQVEVLLGKDGRNYCLKVEAERDAALNERANFLSELAVQKLRAERAEASLTTMVERADNDRLQKAHDHQYNMAGLMLREAEKNGRERDEAKALLKKARYFLDPMGPVDPNDRRACINAIDKAIA